MLGDHGEHATENRMLGKSLGLSLPATIQHRYWSKILCFVTMQPTKEFLLRGGRAGSADGGRPGNCERPSHPRPDLAL